MIATSVSVTCTMGLTSVLDLSAKGPREIFRVSAMGTMQPRKTSTLRCHGPVDDGVR